MFDVQIAVAKTNKYASRESGDTAEVVERPHGGFSVVLADGQGSGHSAKSISHLVTARAISMIKDGVRDGAVARSVHDYLYAFRGGKVSATLVIVSVDLTTRTLVLTRNSHCPVLLSLPGQEELHVVESPSNPIGIYAMTKPVVSQLPLEPHTRVVTYTDGVMEAGHRDGRPINVQALVAERLADGDVTARQLADDVLAQALTLDANRPADDMTVLVLSILPFSGSLEPKLEPLVRRMDLHIPVD